MARGSLVRGTSLISQLTDTLRDQIKTGRYAPGQMLPSETQLMNEHGVSRAVIRPAIAQLRLEGLISVAQGKGSFVRETPPVIIVNRTDADPWADLTSTGEAHKQREYADEATAAILGVEEHEELYLRTQSGAREGHTVQTRRIIPSLPLESIEPEPDPFGERAALIAALTKHYGPLETDELIRGYVPNPDDATALGIVPGAPALELTRLTFSRDRRPLMAEIERTAVEGTAYAFKLPPTRAN